MATLRDGGQATKRDDMDPELALLGGILKQACRDATQTANERLRAEAWEFLDICAPDIATRLRRQAEEGGGIKSLARKTK